MPFLIPIIAAAVGSLIAAEVIVTVIEIAAMMLISALLRPSNQGSQLSNGQTEEYSGTVEPRRIVYGQTLVSGLNAIPPWAGGLNNGYLEQILVIAGHEVAAILDVWLNQIPVASASIGAITGSSSDGAVTTGPYANKIWLRRHTGASGETYDWQMNNRWSSFWTTAHVGTGLAKIYCTFLYDQNVYSQGKPEVRCIVRGKKVYDPRLDTSPGANPTTTTYITYSSNPALCIVDYLLDPLGLGDDATRIDWTSAVAAANLCDEQVAIPLLSALTPAWSSTINYVFGNCVTLSGTTYQCILAHANHTPPNVTYWTALAGGTLQQTRYTCNTVLDCTAAYEDNLKMLAAAMQGAVLYSSGKWILLPGHYIAGTFDITDDDMIPGSMDYLTAIPYASRYNAVRGQYYDPTNLYQPMDYPSIRVSADESTDGEGPVWRELQQPTCTDIFESQRNAIIEQRKSRRKKTWAFPANARLYSIRPGEFGTLSIAELGINTQPVRCVGWKLSAADMKLAISLEEISSSDWNDPATGIYQTATSLSTPAPASYVPDPVTSVSATPVAGGILFTWNLPAVWHSDLQVQLGEAASDNIAGASIVWQGVNTGIYLKKEDEVLRYYWVRVINLVGGNISTTDPSSPTGGLIAGAGTLDTHGLTDNAISNTYTAYTASARVTGTGLQSAGTTVVVPYPSGVGVFEIVYHWSYIIVYANRSTLGATDGGGYYTIALGIMGPSGSETRLVSGTTELVIGQESQNWTGAANPITFGALVDFVGTGGDATLTNININIQLHKK